MLSTAILFSLSPSLLIADIENSERPGPVLGDVVMVQAGSNRACPEGYWGSPYLAITIWHTPRKYKLIKHAADANCGKVGGGIIAPYLDSVIFKGNYYITYHFDVSNDRYGGVTWYVEPSTEPVTWPNNVYANLGLPLCIDK